MKNLANRLRMLAIGGNYSPIRFVDNRQRVYGIVSVDFEPSTVVIEAHEGTAGMDNGKLYEKLSKIDKSTKNVDIRVVRSSGETARADILWIVIHNSTLLMRVDS